MFDKRGYTRKKVVRKVPLVVSFISLLFLFLFLVSFPSLSFSQAPANVTSVTNQTQVGDSMNTVHITKSSTNSYDIIDDMTGFVTAFDTSYSIVGSSDSLNKSRDQIISMVQDDYEKSPTIGYVIAANVTDPAGPSSSIANPFVDLQTINSTIAQMLSSGLDTAHSLNYTTVTVKCDFDMRITDWNCDAHGIFE